jgi:hypothetical protein
MSTVAHATVINNSASFTEEMLDATEGSPSESPDAVAGATEAEQKAIDEYRASEARVVDLAVQTLDPKDMLKKYARLGCEALKLAQKRKGSFKAWAKQDFEKVCTDLETLVKMRVAIKDIRMGVYVRVHLWVEAVKALCPNVEKLSYFQVSNKFLPTLAFDPVELTGEIRKEWLTWVRTAVERQLGDEPMSIKDLDQSIDDQKKEIERARTAKKDPEKLLEQERKATEVKSKKERRDGQNKIVESLDAAITNGHADVNDVVQIVDQVLKSNNLTLPAKVVGFDPATCTAADCKTLAAAMAGAGKIAEMKILRDTLDAMIKIAEHALLTRAAG